MEIDIQNFAGLHNVLECVFQTLEKLHFFVDRKVLDVTIFFSRFQIIACYLQTSNSNLSKKNHELPLKKKTSRKLFIFSRHSQHATCRAHTHFSTV